MNIDLANIKNYPSTRYQGSKRKIIPWIYENIKDLNFETVLDIYGGTGSVSYMFKKMGKTVTYNDSLRFNYLIGKAVIENKEIRLNESDVEFLLNHKSEEAYNKVQKFFHDIYYYPKENKWIDKTISAIESLNSYPAKVLEFKSALAYYSLFQACLIKRPFNLFHRKNLNLRKNKVKRTFGNYTSWNKSFIDYYLKFIDEANDLVFDNGKECFSTNYLVEDIDKIEFDLVYLDPPYYRKDSSNETSDYQKVYHFLEGLAHYNNWEELIDFNSINRRFKRQIKSAEPTNMELIKTFEEIFYRFKSSHLVFSYKKGGTPSIETLVKLLKRYKKNVFTRSFHYKYALNHQNGNARKNREVLIIAV